MAAPLASGGSATTSKRALDVSKKGAKAAVGCLGECLAGQLPACGGGGRCGRMVGDASGVTPQLR